MALNLGIPFTTTLPGEVVTILGTTHGCGHRFLRVQVWDNGTPRQRLVPGPVQIHPTTFDVSIPFLQPQSGLIVLNGGTPPPGPQGNQAFVFPAIPTWHISGTAHGYGTDHLLIDVYDAATPRRWVPAAAVSIDPASFDIDVYWGQPQAGLFVVCAASDVGTPNVGLALPGGLSATFAAAAHGYSSPHLGFQVYDASGASVLPGSATLDTTTREVTLGFVQPQAGRVVFNASDTLVTADANFGMLFTASGPTYAVTVPGGTHGYGHPYLRVQAWDAQTPRRRLRPLIAVHPGTRDVTAHFGQPESGLLVVNAGTAPPPSFANKGFPFSTTTPSEVVTIAGAAHGYTTDRLLVDVYDDGTPRALLPKIDVRIDPFSFDITVRPLQPQSGLIVVCGTSGVFPSNSGTPFTTTIPNETVTLAGVTHARGTPNLGVQLYDTSTPEVLAISALVTVDAASFDVTATFLQPQSGTLVLNGSARAASLLADSGTMTVAGTAATLQAFYRLASAAGAWTLTGTAVVQRLLLPAALGTVTLAVPPVPLRIQCQATGGSVSLAGAAVTSTLTVPALGGVLSVPGSAASFGLHLAATPGSVDLSGEDVPLILTQGFLTESGAVTVTGASVVPRLAIPTSGASLSLLGTAAGMQATLPATLGSSSLAGSPSGLALRLPSTLGATSLAGTAATFLRTYRTLSASGPVTLTGILATLVRTGHPRLSGETGTVALTGQSTTLRAIRRLIAAGGSSTLVGTAAVARVAVSGSAGSMVLATPEAVLDLARGMEASAGSVTLVGPPLALRATLPASAGSLTGAGVAMLPRVALPALAGLLALTGSPSALRLRLAVTGGTATLAGTDATFPLAQGVVVEPGSLTLLGSAASLRVHLAAAGGSSSVTGQAASLLYGQETALLATAGSVAVAGSSVTLRSLRRCVSTATPLLLTGVVSHLVVRLPGAASPVLTTGLATAFHLARHRDLEAGVLTLAGEDAALKYGRAGAIETEAGVVVLAGGSSTGRVRLPAAAGTLALIGGILAPVTIPRVLPAGPGLAHLHAQPATFWWSATMRRRVEYPAEVHVVRPDGTVVYRYRLRRLPQLRTYHSGVARYAPAASVTD